MNCLKFGLTWLEISFHKMYLQHSSKTLTHRAEVCSVTTHSAMCDQYNPEHLSLSSKCWLAIQSLWYFWQNRKLRSHQGTMKPARSPLQNLTISGKELEIVIMGNIFDIYTIGNLVDNH